MTNYIVQIVNAPNATDTFAAGIDAAGDVAGTLDTANTSTAFIDKNGVFSPIAPTNAASSYVNAIGASGAIVGNYYDAAANQYAFVSSNGTAKTINVPSAVPTGISNNGTYLTGFYFDGAANQAFIYSNDKYNTLPYLGSQASIPSGVNNFGEVVGRYFDGTTSEAFTYSSLTQTYSHYQHGSDATSAVAVNDSGLVVGDYQDSQQSNHGYTQDANGTLTFINVPGAVSTVATSVNNLGQVAGTFVDAQQKQHVFVYDPTTQTYSTIDVANATPFSISDVKLNDSGTVAGDYQNSGNNLESSFVAAPAPVVVPPPVVLPPVVTLTSAATNLPNHTTQTITGTVVSGTGAAVANQSVTLTDNNQPLTTATTDSAGKFSVSLALPNLGTNSILASVVDSHGLSGTSTAVVDTTYTAVSNLDSTSQKVEQLFYSLLNRAADAPSLASFDQSLERHPSSLAKVASSLITSREYRTLHGRQTNTEFVEALFIGAFGRQVDAGSLASDVHALQHGESRQALAASLSQTPEAVAHIGPKPVA